MSKRPLDMVTLSWTLGRHITFFKEPGVIKTYTKMSRQSIYRLVRVVRASGLQIFPQPDGWSAKVPEKD